MTKTKENSNIIAVITMIFLFGMISFVTNLAAPIGNIWKMQPGIEGSNTLGMMGNMMNFLAYAIMGIPAGNLLKKKGYKFTILAALLVGLLGVFVQFLSGIVGVGSTIGNIPTNFFVYLFGAFICGFSVCMLNTVVNPMLKILGGKRSNQYIQIGGSFNSLMGTLTPMLVGSMIGTLTHDTLISDVNTLLFMAMGVFAVAFVILLFVPIQNPEAKAVEGQVENPLKFKHFILGAIAIFVYVGVEVGIPGTLNFYLSDPVKGAGMDPASAVAIAGFVAGTYWFLMLVGRLISSAISGKVSSRTQLTCVSASRWISKSPPSRRTTPSWVSTSRLMGAASTSRPFTDAEQGNPFGATSSVFSVALMRWPLTFMALKGRMSVFSEPMVEFSQRRRARRHRSPSPLSAST